MKAILIVLAMMAIQAQGWILGSEEGDEESKNLVSNQNQETVDGQGGARTLLHQWPWWNGHGYSTSISGPAPYSATSPEGGCWLITGVP